MATPIFDHHDVEIEHYETVYQGFCRIDQLKLRHRRFIDHQFSDHLSRELIKRRPAVGVLIYDPAHHRFALIEQFRVGALTDPVSPWQLEIVAGLIDDGETAEQAAIRECREETGILIEQLTPLFHFYPSAGACDETLTLFAAQADLRHAQGLFGAPDEGEDIRLHVFDYQHVDQLMHSGRVANAPLIIALQWLQTQHRQTQDG